MKSNKSSKKTDNDDNDDLEGLKEAFKKHKERQKGGSNSNDWDKIENGKNIRYFLPIAGQRKYYTEGWTHFNVGPNERALRCIDEAHIDVDRNLPMSGTKCPRCKRFLREQARINSEYQKGDADGQEEWKRAKDKFVPRHQFYSNTLRKDDEGDFEVKITAYGPQVWGQLMNYYVGDDTDVGDFTNPKSGKWLNIKKEAKGGKNRRNVEYKVFPVEGPDIYPAWKSIKEALHDLDQAPGKILSLDEFVAIEKGTDVSRDAGDDSSDGERRRSKPRDDDDGGSEDENADIDEDDRPVSKKKSSLSQRRRDD